MDKVGLKIPFFPINLRHFRSSLVLVSVINPKKYQGQTCVATELTSI